jgi:hypothetical protein
MTRSRNEVTGMTRNLLAIGVLMYYFLASLHSASAQALGEYGRTLGGATQRHGNTVPHVPHGGSVKGNAKRGFKGVGDLGVQPLRNELVVVTNRAPLYQSQDDETPRIDELPTGTILVPIIQATSGATAWYMVKSPTGIIGWVKSADVLEQSAKK